MKYNIDAEVIYANSMGPNPRKLLHWNLQNLMMPPGSKILDLGSGKSLTAVYLANGLDCDVIAYDKDLSPDEALETMLSWRQVEKA